MCMRRFIVIFLFLLLPIQVLAEPLGDMRAALVEAVDTAAADADAASKRSTSSPDTSTSPQLVNADINDSVNSATLYVHGALSVDLWPEYRPAALPSVYLPVTSPPRIDRFTASQM